MVSNLLKKEIIKQFLKFCLVGLESAVVYYLVFLLIFYFAKINYLIASGTGFICGALIGYKFNRLLSFSSNRKNIVALPIYIGIYLFSLIFTIISMRFLVEILEIVPVVSILIVIFFTTLINFFGVKFLAFKNKKW